VERRRQRRVEGLTGGMKDEGLVEVER